MLELEIGKPFVIDKPLYMSDGSKTGYLKHGDFVHIVYLQDMVQKEKSAIKEGDISFRFLEKGDFVYILIRYGSDHPPLMFEFIPKPLGDTEVAKDIEKYQKCDLQIVAVESRNNIVKVVRQTTIPEKLHNKLVMMFKNSCEKNNYEEEYTRWLNGFLISDLLTLWDMAKPI